MSPLLSLIVIAGLCLADATKQPTDVMEHLQQEFDALKLTMEMKYKADIERLSRQVAQQNAHIDDITKQIVGLKEHRDHLPIPGTYRNITQEMTGVVAFYARIAGFTGSSSQDSPIPFNVVDLNVGNAYNPDTGEFVAPVDGLYSISFDLLAGSACGTTNFMAARMYVNGALISDSGTTYPNSAGTAVTVQLSSGQAVWMALQHNAPCITLNNYDKNHKFSGHLLYQII